MHVLRQLTREEARETWLISAERWAKGLTTDQYIAREEAQLDAEPECTTFWCLVDDTDPKDILSACELIHRPCYVARAGHVSTVDGYGVASVFCRQSYRRRGYASEMMRLVSEHLRRSPVVSPLYSAVGATFYDRAGGWRPETSTSLVIPLTSTESNDVRLSADEMDVVWETDARYISEVVRQRSLTTSRTCLAFIPTSTLGRWQRARTIYTARVTRPELSTSDLCWGLRISDTDYCTWVHDFDTNPTTADDALYMTRLRYTTDANLRRLVSAASAEAIKWRLSRLTIWNPPAGMAELTQGTFEEERADSLSCLLTAEEHVDWLFNERYAWC